MAEKALCGFYKGTNPIDEGSLRPNHLLKASFPNIITAGFRISHMSCGRTQTLFNGYKILVIQDAQVLEIRCTALYL